MTHHPDYWSEILGHLLTFERLPEPSPNSVPSFRQKHTASKDLWWQLVQEEEQVADDVDIAINAWPGDPAPWRGLSDLGVYFLRLRVESSLEFVSKRLGDLDESGRQMFKGPEDIDPIDFARYLMTEWWSSSGREIAADSLILKWHDAEVASLASQE